MSVWRNDINCRYIFIFPVNNLARKALKLDNIQSGYKHLFVKDTVRITHGFVHILTTFYCFGSLFAPFQIANYVFHQTSTRENDIMI